jgi:hypothetical protein
MRLRRTMAAVGGACALLLAGAPAGAQPETRTEHYTADFSQAFIGPCDGSTGTLTVQGEGIFQLVDTGRTFQLHDILHGSFSFDPDDPALETLSGHFVSQHRESVNYGQLKDFRVTDMIRSVGSTPGGRNLPVHTTLTVHFSADGDVEVKVDSIRCGGELIQ